MTIDELLADHTAPVVALVGELRAIVLDEVPDAIERVHPGWHAIGFHHPWAGYLGGIFPRQAHVELLFEHGRALPDPTGFLTKHGTQTASALLRPGDDIDPEVIGRLLDAAIEHRLQR